MGSSLQALLTRWDAAIEAQVGARGLRAFAVPQGMLLIPLPEAPLPEGPTLGFQHLASDIADWASTISARQPVAYLEQWTFAGPGQQSAVVWLEGSIILGPHFTSTESDCDPPFVFVDRHEPTAVHLALRQLGVQRGDAVDEYAALGLDAKRHTRDWFA